MMDEGCVKRYLERFNKEHCLAPLVAMENVDFVELTREGIESFSEKCRSSLDETLSKIPATGALIGAVFFENYLMIAQHKRNRAEYFTRQTGRDEVPYWLVRCSKAVSSMDESDPVGNFISWTIKPTGDAGASKAVFKQMLSKTIKICNDRISDNHIDCTVYMPSFSSKTEFPDWKRLLLEIVPEIDSEISVNLKLKDLGELVKCPMGKTHYLVIHKPAVQQKMEEDAKSVEYCVVSAYRTELNGIRRCLGCTVYDMEENHPGYELRAFPDIDIRMKEVLSKSEQKCGAKSTASKELKKIPTQFEIDESLYTFLGETTDSFMRKTYRLGVPIKGADDFLQKMWQKYEGNREFEIADLCTEMTGNNDLNRISLGDAAYLAKRIHLETKQKVFIETGLSMHNSKNASFGGCAIIPSDSDILEKLPANFAEATWRVQRNIHPVEYGTIKRKNLKKFTLDQVIEAIVAHNDNCTAADIAVDLLYFYGTDGDMEPSALFTAKVFLYLAKMPTIQFKAAGGQAHGGIAYIENLGREIAPVPVKKAKTQGKAVSSATRREANFDSFGWYKPERAVKQSVKTSGSSSRKMIRPEGKMIRIGDADLSIRTYNSLKRAGIRYLNDLTDKSEKELFKIRYLGKKGVDEVRDRLESYGLSEKA